MRYILVAILIVAGCKSSSETVQPDASEGEPVVQSEEPFTGAVTRDEILAGSESWAGAFAEAEFDNAAATRLAEVEPGAEVTIWLGVWCGDSRREVTRWWKAVDAAGDLPFTVEMIGVARGFGERYEDLEAVPTFVVTRDGREVGRVVETSVTSIEKDVLALLAGEKSGKISASR